MVKAKKTNQMTRRDKKRLEEQNSQCNIKKPSADRLTGEESVICKVINEYGGKRFGCSMVHTNSLNIQSLKEIWKTPDLEFETEIRAKLKGSIRNNSKSKVSVGKLVRVSYGDTIDFMYSPEEMNYITSYLEVKNDDNKGEVVFNEENEDDDKPEDDKPEDDKPEDDINLDDI